MRADVCREREAAGASSTLATPLAVRRACFSLSSARARKSMRTHATTPTPEHHSDTLTSSTSARCVRWAVKAGVHMRVARRPAPVTPAKTVVDGAWVAGAAMRCGRGRWGVRVCECACMCVCTLTRTLSLVCKERVESVRFFFLVMDESNKLPIRHPPPTPPGPTPAPPPRSADTSRTSRPRRWPWSCARGRPQRRPGSRRRGS